MVKKIVCVSLMATATLVAIDHSEIHLLTGDLNLFALYGNAPVNGVDYERQKDLQIKQIQSKQINSGKEIAMAYEDAVKGLKTVLSGYEASVKHESSIDELLKRKQELTNILSFLSEAPIQYKIYYTKAKQENNTRGLIGIESLKALTDALEKKTKQLITNAMTSIREKTKK